MQHSKLGASSAQRWLNCPGSVKLSEGMPSQESSFALEGTAAHKLGEICLRNGSHPDNYIDLMVTLDDASDYPVSEEMAEAVGIYVEYVRERSLMGDMSIETRFDLSFVHEGMFGTNDACVYSNILGVLEVIDYKHGAGIPVSPEDNVQLAYYGLGAAKVHNLHPDSEIKLTIVQPRASGDAIKSWSTTVGYLKEFEKVLRAGALATEQVKAKLAEGSWCRFCIAQAGCPQLEKKSLEVAKAEFRDTTIVLPEVESLTKPDIQKILSFSSIMKSWLKSIEAFAFSELEGGKVIDGYKLVKKKANRKWKLSEYETYSEIQDEMALGDSLPKEWFTEPKLKSPAQLEKLVDKNLVASLCEIPDTGNTMAPSSDRRPEILPSLQSEFSVITDEDLG